MKPVDTKRIRKILERKGCVWTGTEGSHEKWTTPGNLSTSIVAGHKQQSPGVLRTVQSTFASEFGSGWLDKEIGR